MKPTMDSNSKKMVIDPFVTSPFKIVEVIERKQNSPDIKFSTPFQWYWLVRDQNQQYKNDLDKHIVNRGFTRSMRKWQYKSKDVKNELSHINDIK